jgi:hypothetical protein
MESITIVPAMQDDPQKLKELLEAGFITAEEYERRSNIVGSLTELANELSIHDSNCEPTQQSTESTEESDNWEPKEEFESSDEEGELTSDTISDQTIKRRTPFSLSVYIYQVLKQVQPDLGISQKAMCIMDSFLHDTFERLATEAG